MKSTLKYSNVSQNMYNIFKYVEISQYTSKFLKYLEISWSAFKCAISPASILSESRKYPNCVHWYIFYFMWLRSIYEFLCVHSNPIWKGRNCRDYRPSHLTFREYFRPFWFSRSCVVVAYCYRCMRSSNVQGFVSTVPTLYEEEEE